MAVTMTLGTIVVIMILGIMADIGAITTAVTGDGTTHGTTTTITADGTATITINLTTVLRTLSPETITDRRYTMVSGPELNRQARWQEDTVRQAKAQVRSEPQQVQSEVA